MAGADAELAAATGDVEEAAPLVPGPGARRAPAPPTTGAVRDVRLLSSAFLFVFLAYHAAQNLQSTVNTVRAPTPTSRFCPPAGRPAPLALLRQRRVPLTLTLTRGWLWRPCLSVAQDENLGDISLGVLYTSFTAFSAVGSAVVRWMGSKRALAVGTSGYLLFIAANLVPSW
jgi:hypothetical protein